MFKILFSLGIVLLYSCGQNKTTSHDLLSDQSVSIEENFDWLLGDWKRINEGANQETFEIWKRSSDTGYVGLGFTIQHGDTIFQEKIRLIKSDQSWSFEVVGKSQVEPTVFKVTKFNKGTFVCENLENEFPKYIKYWQNDKNISALIYNDSTTEVSFDFVKR